MNVRQLTDRIRRLTGIRMPDILSDDQILELINESYREVLALTDWPFLHRQQDVTVTSNQFDTGEVFRDVQAVIATDGTRLRQTTISDMEMYDEQPDDEPFAYARLSDRKYRVWPDAADGTTLNVRGVYSPPELMDPYDVPVFDDEFHIILAYSAASRALSEESDDSGRVEMYLREAAGVLDRMRMRYLTTKDRGIFKMGGKRRRRDPRWSMW